MRARLQEPSLGARPAAGPAPPRPARSLPWSRGARHDGRAGAAGAGGTGPPRGLRAPLGAALPAAAAGPFPRAPCETDPFPRPSPLCWHARGAAGVSAGRVRTRMNLWLGPSRAPRGALRGVREGRPSTGRVSEQPARKPGALGLRAAKGHAALNPSSVNNKYSWQ